MTAAVKKNKVALRGVMGIPEVRIRAKGYLSFSICAIKSEENNLSLLVSMDKGES